MGQFTGKYLKAWKVTDKGNFKLVDLGDSDKQQDGTYKNFTWFNCMFVSGAGMLSINEKDTIEVKSAKITMEKFNDKWSPKIVVFDATIVERQEPQATPIQPQKKERFTDQIPF